MSVALIHASLEAAAETGIDPTQRIYARLFARYPELEVLFDMDTDGGVRGSMLQQAFDCLLDDLGQGLMARTILSSERQNHLAYGVPDGVFEDFFADIRDTIRELAGQAWTSATDQAWTDAITRIKAAARAPARC